MQLRNTAAKRTSGHGVGGVDGQGMSLTYADAHRELAEELDEQLRAAVRRDGIDPQRDTGQVHLLARRLVADHDQRSLTGIVRPVAEPEAMVEELPSTRVR